MWNKEERKKKRIFDDILNQFQKIDLLGVGKFTAGDKRRRVQLISPSHSPCDNPMSSEIGL